MPATEQTWRDQKTLHVVFGASALVMAIATVWMMSADHNREWKDWQLKDRKKDAWMTQSRRDVLADIYATQMEGYESEIRKYDSQPISRELIDQFEEAVRNEDLRLQNAGDDVTSESAKEDSTVAGDANRVTHVVYKKTAAASEPQFAKLEAAVGELDAATAPVLETEAELVKLQAELAKAKEAQAAAAATPPKPEEAEAAAKAVEEQSAKIAELEGSIKSTNAKLLTSQDAAIAARGTVLANFNDFIREARRRENTLVALKKSLNGQRTARVSELGIKIGQNADQKLIDATQEDISNLDRQITELTAGIAAAKEYRMSLEAIVAAAQAEKVAAAKELDAMKTELSRLDEQVYQNTSNFGEWITRWPVLNALYSGNVRVEQNWLPDMTINYNFSQVARFDRCTTCHRAIAKTAPGTATSPMYPTLSDAERDQTLQLFTPEEKPAEGGTLKQVYGMELSPEGIVNEGDVTVHFVLPESAAARAGLKSGDVIRAIDGNQVYSPEAAAERLLTMAPWGSSVKVEIRRGLDHPFTAHPRLDLFLTDSSPHPMKDVGCTICHDGQGSGTSFPWTSHTPDNADEQNRWARDLGWFDNHHWIFPMKPQRFTESNCLKCHHDKGSLEPSERFPEPPAPKLVEGWSLVEDFGCFGCHEINGFDSPLVSVGPDVRLEPAFHEAAAQMLRSDLLNDEQRDLARQLMAQPTDPDVRNQLLTLLTKTPDTDEAGDTAPAAASAEGAADLQKLASLLKDVEIPGKYRKVGPSLRHINSKVDYDWLYSWIRKPADFRPSTKMPQFFGLHEHLSDADDANALAESHKFEPIEIRALTEYLLKASTEFEYLKPAEGVTEQASAERGKWQFETRGCLACHSHEEFPGVTANQGPDLSRMGAKVDTDKGRQWLYSWVKQPNRYHQRTVMPELFLEPLEEKDAQNKPTGKVTDPAADITAFLLGVETDWKPENIPARGEFTAEEKQALADLAQLWLTSDAIPASRAKKYLQGSGFDESQRSKLKADERLLIGLNDENRVERQLEFVARRTIGKYGCFGCHDIPGFEDAKPIGTALVDWGRKETSKLAFENIHKFLETHGINPKNPGEDSHAAGESASAVQEPSHDEASTDAHAEGEQHAVSHGHLDPADFSDKDSYFVQSLNSHGRDGFLWQKLRYPRSYDYKTTRNKNFNERLRMPKFDFAHTVRKDGESDEAFAARSQADDDAAREAIMTFVLGLVKEPPASKYIFRPDPRQQAIVDGRQVLERFNCAGCHTLRQEQWEFDYASDTFEDSSEVVDYPFLAPKFTEQQIAESKAKDYRGMLHASIQGHPVFNEETGETQLVDQDRAPITLEELAEAEAEEGEEIPVFYQFTLWRNELINGQPRLRGIDELLIPADRAKYGPANGDAYPAWGGDLARYLFPKVIEKAKEKNPQVIAREAWGWLPPPLMDEGKKVQTDWLHGFLLDPYALRPAAVMRMPNFHMSTDEAAKLVDFFAAMSNAPFPYEYKPQQRASYLAKVSQQRENPLAEAMNIVTDGNYCVKCHAVADFVPVGDPNTFGPNLADVSRRLRPEFTRDWIANPARILPYTGMPVNIPYRPDDPHMGGVAQNLFKGTSVQQLTGVVDLLMNFDAYARGNTSVTPLVQQSQAVAAAAQQGAPAAGAGVGDDPARSESTNPLRNSNGAEGSDEPTQ